MLNLLYWLLVLIAFLILWWLSTHFLAWLRNHQIKINRWLWAIAAFLVVMIPKGLIKNMPLPWTIVLYVLCAFFALNFMVEQHHWLVTSDKFKY